MIVQRLSRLLAPGDRSILRRYLGRTAIYCAVQGAAFVLVLPIMQALLENAPDRAVTWLAPLALGVAATWGLGYVATLDGFQIAIQLLKTLRHRIGDHVVTLPLGWFSSKNVGPLGVLLSQGVMELLGLPAHQLTPLLRATLTPVVLVLAMAFFDWQVALVGAVIFPCLALVYWWAGRLGRAADRATHEAAAEAAERMVEFAQNQAVLRAYDGGRLGRELFDAALVAQSRASRRQLWMVLPPLLANSWLAQLGFLALMATVAWLALGDDDPGHVAMLIAMLVLVNRIVDPLTEVAAHGAGIRMASMQIDAFDAVLAAQALPTADPPAAPPVSYGIELEDIGFGYRPDAAVLTGVSFRLPANTTTVLLGSSGSGKSTILQLIARFADPDRGTIRIGGTDLRQLDKGELMRLVAPVFQDTYLFSGTLRDNVQIGNPSATEEDLQHVAALARLDEMVARLPGGWDSEVGERGMLLSGGERQRVCIARALLKRAPILLLDEISSALDDETQLAIAESLHSLQAGATILMITHRLAAVRNADQILVLDGGRIVEAGNHVELLAAGGRYAAFWRAQEASEGWRLTP